jgi:3-hydroxybutyryl-CoA dehydrogenase
MDHKISNTEQILVIGNCNLAYTISLCLYDAGHNVSLSTNDPVAATEKLLSHLSSMRPWDKKPIALDERFVVSLDLKNAAISHIAIAITEELLSAKKELIALLENKLPRTAMIAINTESIGLDVLQQDSKCPERICGLNWVEPAHTTRFLEIISNRLVQKDIPVQLADLATRAWNKDPYQVQNFGVRSRLMSAMVREAFYLVQHGYASVEDIDRACRNDAGYYLPFAGNCRYMDLMGTYAYGMVMKDLNPDLCKDDTIPDFFTKAVKAGKLGMQSGEGIYKYTDEEVALWKTVMNKFSYEIQDIINKYPFNYKDDNNSR